MTLAGNLTVVEGGADIPFTIARTYWLYDVPGGESRGGHAHKQLWQLIVSASGSFEVCWMTVGTARRSPSTAPTTACSFPR